jgi:hypothetical protein
MLPSIRECVRCIGTRKETRQVVIASIQTAQAGVGGGSSGKRANA